MTKPQIAHPNPHRNRRESVTKLATAPPNPIDTEMESQRSRYEISNGAPKPNRNSETATKLQAAPRNPTETVWKPLRNCQQRPRTSQKPLRNRYETDISAPSLTETVTKPQRNHDAIANNVPEPNRICCETVMKLPTAPPIPTENRDKTATKP